MRAEASFEVTGKTSRDCRIGATEGKEPVRWAVERWRQWRDRDRRDGFSGQPESCLYSSCKNEMDVSHKIITVYYVIIYLDGWKKKSQTWVLEWRLFPVAMHFKMAARSLQIYFSEDHKDSLYFGGRSCFWRALDSRVYNQVSSINALERLLTYPIEY